MNINDVKDSDLGITGEDKLDQIFRRQLELMQKYHGIEKANGLSITDDVPVNLHDAKGQYRLKDFAWRITEELGEAFEALRVHPDILEHYEEEIADALHFLVEFTILSGAPPRFFGIIKGDKLEHLFGGYGLFDISRASHRELQIDMAMVIEALAVTCNCLKNKPWKITQMMTDTAYFHICLIDVWNKFIYLCWSSGMNADILLNLYFKKSEVNKFRQRTNY